METKSIKKRTRIYEKKLSVNNHKEINRNSQIIKKDCTRILEKSFSKEFSIVKDGKIIRASVNFARIVGYEYPSVLGLIIIDFVVLQIRLQVGQNFKSMQVKSYETLMQRKDGAIMPVVTCGIYIPDSYIIIWMISVKD